MRKNFTAKPSALCQRVGGNAFHLLRLIFQEREKFGTCTGVVFKSAQKTGGLHDRVLFLNASHHHAKVFRFYYHGHARGLQAIHERLGDLGCKILLNLQTPRENIDNARHLGKTNHLPVWKVSHMRATDEGKQMVLTQRIKLNVFDQDDLTRTGLENGPVDDLVEILPITLREKLQRAPRPIWGSLETLSINIFPNGLKQFTVRIRNSVEVSLWQAIVLARETFLNIKIGIMTLNHVLCFDLA
jgi:hypothetical protein